MKKLFFIFILIILSSIIGCDNNKSNENSFYLYKEISNDIEIDEIYNFSYHNNSLILIGTSGDKFDFLSRKFKAITFDLEGNIVNEVVIDEEPILLANVDSQGMIWVLRYKKNISYGQPVEYEIICFDNEGNYIKVIDLGVQNDLIINTSFDKLIVGIQDGDVHFYIHKNISIRQESIIGDLLIFDKNGNIVDLSEKAVSNIMDLFRLNDGRVFVRILNDSNATIICVCINCSDKCNQEERAIVENINNTFGYTIVNGNDNFDLLMVNKGKVYGSDLKGERTIILDWMEEGINNSGASMYKHTIIVGESLFTLTYSPSFNDDYGTGGKTNIIILEKLNEIENNKNKAKKIINIAALYADEKIISSVVNFNKTNPDYYADVKVYSESGFSWVEQDDINNFNIDLASGYTPDLVFLARNTPNLSYATRGLFVDLYEFMERDSEFNKDAYLCNIFNLLEIDGKLNLATTSFSINTLAGKLSEFGDKRSWTWDEYNTFLAGMTDNGLPIGSAPLGLSGRAITKGDFISAILMQRIDEFVDFINGSSSFENPIFIQFLRETERFPLKREDYTDTIDFSLSTPPLLWMPNFTAFYGEGGFFPKQVEYWTFKEEMVYIGFPTNEKDKNGSSCYPLDLFAIFANANEKDGAWEFVKFLLTDYQETMSLMNSLSGFPVKISVLNNLSEYVKKPELYDVLKLPPPTDKEIERVLELVYSLEYIDLIDINITNIIFEEAFAYFIGQKTPEEVAAIIQNRVSIYLAEIN